MEYGSDSHNRSTLKVRLAEVCAVRPQIEERFAFWREIFWRKAVGIIAAFWFAIGTWDLIKSELLPDAYQSLTVVKLIPHISWRSWVMGVLVILIVALLEGSHVAIKKRNERIAELQRRDQALSKDLPIIGNAELLIHRLNRDDLTAIDELTYRINLGIFIRTSVAVTDKPRTISAFRLELYAEDQKYSADAEREIGTISIDTSAGFMTATVAPWCEKRLKK
jgi:hypothetical protein